MKVVGGGVLAVVVGVAQGVEALAFDPVQVVQNHVGTDRELLKFAKSCPGGIEQDRSTKDRFCEAEIGAKDAPMCGCKEVCHIWGDPHVSPFFSACSEVGMHKPGYYTIYELPANDDVNRIPIRIEAKVEKVKVKEDGTKKTFKFVQKVYVSYAEEYDACEDAPTEDKPLFFDVKDCPEEEEDQLVQSESYDLLRNPDTGESVKLYFDVKCAYRHGPHLNVTVTLDDSFASTDGQRIVDALKLVQRPSATRSSTVLPDSSLIFDDDFGLCTDPLRYSKKNVVGKSCTYPAVDVKQYTKKGKLAFWMADDFCLRPSDLSDGRACVCKESCAAYGDPHVYSFNVARRPGNSFKAYVKEPEFRVIYSITPFISFVAQVDKCQFITAVHVVVPKDVLLSEIPSHPDDYKVTTYTAAEYCSEEKDIMPETRKRIEVPEVSDERYSSKVRGFNAGQFLVTKNIGTLVVPPKFEGRVKDFANSLATSGPIQEESLIIAGGVRATLKCHMSKEHKNAVPKTGTKFFNVCIDRSEIAVESVQQDAESRRIQNGDSSEDSVGFRASPDEAPVFTSQIADSLMGVEKELKSDGWCATGKVFNAKKRKFMYRDTDETTMFLLNPEEQS